MWLALIQLASEVDRETLRCLSLCSRSSQRALRIEHRALPMSARLPKVTLAFCPSDPCAVGIAEIGLHSLVMGSGVGAAGGSTFWLGKFRPSHAAKHTM